MQEEIKKLKERMDKIEKILAELSLKISQMNQLQMDVSDKQIINKKIQFLQPVYDKTGTKKIN